MPGAFSGNDFTPQKQQGTVITVIVAVMFVLLAGRLYYFQVIDGDQYRQDSERNSVRKVTLEAPRGLLFDRHGALLVENRASYTISAIPFEIADSTISRLGDILHLDSRGLRTRIRKQTPNPFEPITLQRDASFETVSIIVEHQLDLPGVTVQIEPTRHYPLGSVASHLLGYVAELSEKDLARLRDQGYQSKDVVGKTGVEKTYEQYLRGKNGITYVEVNAHGQEIGLLRGVSATPPVPGQNVYLTIDVRVQLAAEAAMGDSISGALVALDPRNGEILALVSKPNFDPNLFPTGIPRAAWHQINTDPRTPLLNRAIDGVYPPASTFKIVSATAALEEHLVSNASRFVPCEGGWLFGGRYFKCWTPEGHGALSLSSALTHSCDVYFYQLGSRLGLERWGDYARAYGMGVPTGIDLAGERSGLIPDLQYYRKDGKNGWSRGKMLNLAIGQGETLVTPIQMAVMIATVANRGTVYVPHVMRSVETPQRQPVVQMEPRVKAALHFEEGTLATLQEALINVVNGGTAGRARITGIQVAGKTGTAENPHGDDHSWFIGYAPADHPAIAVALVVENAPHGAAVPIVRRVIEEYLLGSRPNTVAMGNGVR